MYIDILVFGKNQEKNNLNLRAFLKQPQDKGKCECGKKLELIGYAFSDDGISTDPHKNWTMNI